MQKKRKQQVINFTRLNELIKNIAYLLVIHPIVFKAENKNISYSLPATMVRQDANSALVCAALSLFK